MNLSMIFQVDTRNNSKQLNQIALCILVKDEWSNHLYKILTIISWKCMRNNLTNMQIPSNWLSEEYTLYFINTPTYWIGCQWYLWMKDVILSWHDMLIVTSKSHWTGFQSLQILNGHAFKHSKIWLDRLSVTPKSCCTPKCLLPCEKTVMKEDAIVFKNINFISSETRL